MYIYIHIYCIHTCVYTYIKHIDIALHTITHTVYIYDYIHTVHVNNINHSPAGLCNSYQFAFFCWDERSSFGLWEVAKRLTPSKMWCFEMEKKRWELPWESHVFSAPWRLQRFWLVAPSHWRCQWLCPLHQMASCWWSIRSRWLAWAGLDGYPIIGDSHPVWEAQ